MSTTVASRADREVWLLTWLPGQGTELHDHGGVAGAMLVLSGNLTEEWYEPATAAVAAQTLDSGSGRRFGPHNVHRVSNRTCRPAVSVAARRPAPW